MRQLAQFHDRLGKPHARPVCGLSWHWWAFDGHAQMMMRLVLKGKQTNENALERRYPPQGQYSGSNNCQADSSAIERCVES